DYHCQVYDSSAVLF
nr:immunoglobulin light chain junction region [Macaca mulatta]MOV66937.1 immunoglobulin light chain junction region [Macaca mulatta]MOV67043.1 immunoglobulin light chain junction region [Macaca mulatta]MOV68894.1 immunoglobulin light chain junction region [Macaca mulatta]MOV70005.1 immunoglobulin light chain junction region [Macaca mulatta]